VREYLSFEDASAFRKNWSTGKVEKVHKRIELFNIMNLKFPAGFVPLVAKALLEELGTVAFCKDERHRPVARDLAADLGWLRDYQLTAIDKIEQRTRGILWLPTGSGKTEIAVGLTRAFPTQWLFVVHKKDLVANAADRYELRTGMPAGRIGDGKRDIQPDFNVASFQTLHRALKKQETWATNLLRQSGGLIIDECHVLPANSFWQVVMTSQAYYRVGLSGTPLARGDRRSLLAIGATGPVLYRIKPELLIKQGVLATPKIRMLPCLQESEKPTWQGVYGDLVVRSTARNRKLTEAALRAARPCLVFVKEVKHGRKLLQRFEKAGMKVEFAYGKHPVEYRQNRIAALERTDLDVLICSVIFQEGIDIPSAIAAVQRMGRGMRSDGGKKTEFELWDIFDTGNKWTEKHARARKRAYEKEGFPVEVEVPARPAAPPLVTKDPTDEDLWLRRLGTKPQGETNA
jgi:superfamily II DNA or RNA helicase